MGYYDKKFKSRKFRLAPDENIKLDKIREPHKDDGNQGKKLNIWIVILGCVGLLLISFAIPKIALFVKDRSRNDAFKWAKDTVLLIRKATMDNGSTVAENTMFVVERNGKYYLFWYTDKAPDAQSHLVEMGESKDYVLPLNVKEGEKISYPFSEPPIEEINGEAKLSDKLEVLQGYKVTPIDDNDEIKRECLKSVHIFTLKPID